MSTELATLDTYFEEYGRAAVPSSFEGEILKFNRGDYVAGADSEEVPVGTKLVACMNTLEIGFLRWCDGRPHERHLGLVCEGYKPPRRSDLGDNDRALWERDANDEPRDPWQFNNTLVMVSPEDQEVVYTYVTGSKGGLSAIGELCKAYGQNLKASPVLFPVITLQVGSYMHRDKSIGRIKFPTFEVVGWTQWPLPEPEALPSTAKKSSKKSY